MRLPRHEGAVLRAVEMVARIAAENALLTWLPWR